MLAASLLPASIREIVTATASELEVPLELPFACALGVASAACQSRWSVSVKPGWDEPTSEYIAVAADPGERKTPTMRRFLAPLIDYERQDRERCQQANEDNASKTAIVAKRIKALEAEAAKSDDLASLAERMDALRAELPQAEQPRRLFVDDVTPEQLSKCMAEANGSMAGISDEGGAFLSRIAGHYNGAPNVDAVLKAWDNGPLRIDRANGRDVYLNNARLSLTLLMQAGVARDTLTNREFMQRGLIHRFLWLMPSNEHIGRRTGNGPATPDHVLSGWSSLITELLLWSPAEVMDSGTKTHPIHLTDAARQRHHRYSQAIERAIGGMDEADPRRTYRQKWPGQTARLAGVLHCMEQAKAGKAPHAAAITDQGMEHAIALASVLLDHADTAMGMLGQDTRIERAKRIVKRMKAIGEPVTSGELWKKMKRVTSLFDGIEQYGDAIELLFGRGYIATKQEGKSEWLVLTPPAIDER